MDKRRVQSDLEECQRCLNKSISLYYDRNSKQWLCYKCIKEQNNLLDETIPADEDWEVANYKARSADRDRGVDLLEEV